MSNFSKIEIDLLQGMFSMIRPMPSNDFNTLLNYLKRASFKRGETILDIGEFETKINFVVQGLVHMYALIDGDEFTVNIALQGMVFNSLNSFLNGIPTNEKQVAVYDTEILYLENEDIQQLLEESHSFSIVYGKLYEQILLEREQRTLLLQYKSAQMRYEYFINTFNRSQCLLNEVPQKLISQYLGLAPETFCRTKNQFLKNLYTSL